MWEAVEDAIELLHEDEYHQALAAFHEVLKTDPQNYYAYHFLGVTLYEVKELEGARDAFRACVKLAPKYLGASIALANLLRELGDPRAALQEAQRAFGMASDDGDVLYAMGMAYAALGERTQAKKFLNAFMGKKPEFEVGVEVQGILDAMEQEAANRTTN